MITLSSYSVTRQGELSIISFHTFFTRTMQCTVKLDAWWLGISLIKLVLGRFLFSEDKVLGDSDSEVSWGSLFPRKLKEVKKDKERRQSNMGERLQVGKDNEHLIVVTVYCQ